ncbi:thiamine phosphate synthase [Hathewaya histolytica]|uniref:Thiamine-phosphate synthase n=1 Tax=Hathewaya histolytica TaxID=1498 RepID=A0A4U9R3A8_HATHI|nr:thiamine phosphate synthase [Hathewaya histolytica]VTQ84483.1 thiamin-phosphate pyrophosphorylase [Hathewaya histolytica]
MRNFDKSKVDYTIYLVTDRDVLNGRDLKSAVEDTILGGATLIQLREKNCSSLEFYNIALEVKEVTTKYNIPLIINDRLDIALAVNSEGVHIGQSDIPLKIAKNILGEEKLIGVSAQTLEQAVVAEREGADYLGVGAIFKTSTKKDAKQGLGLELLREIKHNIKIPIVGIGGINHSNAKLVMDTGVQGVSIVSCILGEENIRVATEDLKNKL